MVGRSYDGTFCCGEAKKKEGGENEAKECSFGTQLPAISHIHPYDQRKRRRCLNAATKSGVIYIYEYE